jgi:hypothetical protein
VFEEAIAAFLVFPSPFNLMIPRRDGDSEQMWSVLTLSRILESFVYRASNDRYFTSVTATWRSSKLATLLTSKASTKPPVDELKKLLNPIYELLKSRRNSKGADRDEATKSDSLLKLPLAKAIAIAMPCFSEALTTSSPVIDSVLDPIRNVPQEVVGGDASGADDDSDDEDYVPDTSDLKRGPVKSAPKALTSGSAMMAQYISPHHEAPLKYASSGSFNVWSTILVRSMFNNSFFVGSFFLMVQLHSKLSGVELTNATQKVRLLCCALKLVPESCKFVANYLSAKNNQAFKHFDQFRYLVLGLVVMLAGAQEGLPEILSPATLEARIVKLLSLQGVIESMISMCNESEVHTASDQICQNVEEQCTNFACKPHGVVRAYQVMKAFRPLYRIIVCYFDDYKLPFNCNLEQVLELLNKMDALIRNETLSYEEMHYNVRCGLVYQSLDKITGAANRLKEVLDIITEAPPDQVGPTTCAALETYLNSIEKFWNLPLTRMLSDAGNSPAKNTSRSAPTASAALLTSHTAQVKQTGTVVLPVVATTASAVAVIDLSAADDAAPNVEPAEPPRVEAEKSTGSRIAVAGESLISAASSAPETNDVSNVAIPRDLLPAASGNLVTVMTAHSESFLQLLLSPQASSLFCEKTRTVLLTWTTMGFNSRPPVGGVSSETRLFEGLPAFIPAIRHCIRENLLNGVNSTAMFSYFRYLVMFAERMVYFQHSKDHAGYHSVIASSESLIAACSKSFNICNRLVKELMLKPAWKLHEIFVAALSSNMAGVHNVFARVSSAGSNMYGAYGANVRSIFTEISEIVAGYLHDGAIYVGGWGFFEFACLVCSFDVRQSSSFMHKVNFIYGRLSILFSSGLLKPSPANIKQAIARAASQKGNGQNSMNAKSNDVLRATAAVTQGSVASSSTSIAAENLSVVTTSAGSAAPPAILALSVSALAKSSTDASKLTATQVTKAAIASTPNVTKEASPTVQPGSGGGPTPLPTLLLRFVNEVISLNQSTTRFRKLTKSMVCSFTTNSRRCTSEQQNYRMDSMMPLIGSILVSLIARLPRDKQIVKFVELRYLIFLLEAKLYNESVSWKDYEDPETLYSRCQRYLDQVVISLHEFLSNSEVVGFFVDWKTNYNQQSNKVHSILRSKYVGISDKQVKLHLNLLSTKILNCVLCFLLDNKIPVDTFTLEWFTDLLVTVEKGAVGSVCKAEYEMSWLMQKAYVVMQNKFGQLVSDPDALTPPSGADGTNASVVDDRAASSTSIVTEEGDEENHRVDAENVEQNSGAAIVSSSDIQPQMDVVPSEISAVETQRETAATCSIQIQSAASESASTVPAPDTATIHPIIPLTSPSVLAGFHDSSKPPTNANSYRECQGHIPVTAGGQLAADSSLSNKPEISLAVQAKISPAVTNPMPPRARSESVIALEISIATVVALLADGLFYNMIGDYVKKQSVHVHLSHSPPGINMLDYRLKTVIRRIGQQFVEMRSRPGADMRQFGFFELLFTLIRIEIMLFNNASTWISYVDSTTLFQRCTNASNIAVDYVKNMFNSAAVWKLCAIWKSGYQNLPHFQLQLRKLLGAQDKIVASKSKPTEAALQARLRMICSMELDIVGVYLFTNNISVGTSELDVQFLTGVLLDVDACIFNAAQSVSTYTNMSLQHLVSNAIFALQRKFSGKNPVVPLTVSSRTAAEELPRTQLEATSEQSRSSEASGRVMLSSATLGPFHSNGVETSTVTPVTPDGTDPAVSANIAGVLMDVVPTEVSTTETVQPPLTAEKSSKPSPHNAHNSPAGAVVDAAVSEQPEEHLINSHEDVPASASLSSPAGESTTLPPGLRPKSSSSTSWLSSMRRSSLVTAQPSTSPQGASVTSPTIVRSATSSENSSISLSQSSVSSSGSAENAGGSMDLSTLKVNDTVWANQRLGAHTYLATVVKFSEGIKILLSDFAGAYLIFAMTYIVVFQVKVTGR